MCDNAGGRVKVFETHGPMWARFFGSVFHREQSIS